MKNYSDQVRNCANTLLLMLDQELTVLEKNHKTGNPYWRRLRVRKRLVQSILDYAVLEPKVMIEKLREEFFQTKDENLLGSVKIVGVEPENKKGKP